MDALKRNVVASAASSAPYATARILSAALHPLQHRLPLRDVFFDARARHVPQRGSDGGKLHIVLRVALITQYRQAEIADVMRKLIRCARAYVHAHADDAERIFGALIDQLLQKSLCGEYVEHGRLQGNDDFVGKTQVLF